ncbi:MAG: SAM-dependent methyltransferase [Candidatus Saccharibacteria bacterium]|nr:SAM-dependent methyltransferase [Candidatus Saccharibacteria bacterium]
MSDNITIDAYDKYAQNYDDSVADFWDRFPRDFLEKFAEHAPGKRVLDVGSGSGRDARLLRDYGFEVVCQDGSSEMVAMTNALGFESHLSEFADMDFAPNSFDAIWAYTSLIHIPPDDARQAIEKLRTYLRPNGVFAIGVIEGNDEGMVDHRTMPDSPRYFKKYHSDELHQLINQLGFTLIHEQKYQPHNSTYINQLYEEST